ncbi:sensor histidine kinase/response regulator, putative [Talaromyces stipitatus ATCC 10500]|uniref:Sensor histidine kinase/response regulator, putative n=1 Tax=Talaromyces stipitatus (strain ATCC 10500 / CBS 375.48 / QM 6759 / NRRL 1006) TaxID=441959 RepID=B8MIG0_TALSN|nr:sensor histidine kinase/response regulator, putative [Talaromyces stipitatus ATCC 10500]EED14644.1 sensor histidine kinase/response regulator, putative [Talaromyces stipitatus ATCC 10500]
MAALSVLPTFDQSPPSEAEKRRIRDLSRYYCAFRNPPASSDDLLTPVESDNQLGPSLSKDIVLTALVQLGVYRFGCNRAFVSLIDGQNQHIISEATASISLRNSRSHLPDDGLYLGVTSLDLVFGVCPHAMKLFSGEDVPQLRNTANVTANPTRFIVRDFTREDNFKDRPYVSGWPHFRFYAELPIYSPAGYVLGSFCVVDDKPRQDFMEADVLALQEISDSISQHLENVRTVHSHARSDRLVQGLTNFVKGRPDDASTSSVASLQGLENLSHLQQRSSVGIAEPSSPNIEALSLASTVNDETSQFLSTQDLPTVTRSTSLSSPPRDSATSFPTIDNTTKDEPYVTSGVERQSVETTGPDTPLVTVKEGIPISKRADALFSHASSLLRESMDLDGVLFLDACHCNYGVGPSADLTDWEPFPTPVDADFTAHPIDTTSDNDKDAFCKILGSATEITNDTPLNTTVKGSITESFLQHLISRYPEGEIFDLDGVVPCDLEESKIAEVEDRMRIRPFRNGPRSPRSDQNALQITAARLANHFPDAKTVVFLPLWDWNKCHWLAGTLIWSLDSERPLELDEFHYFKVFGDAIISEITKAESFELENSKSDFISSVSHELRSPLHGMLASAELLLGTPLEPEQRDLVKMLETCGLTLLDTMNHLLDFTKINNLMSIEENANPFHGPATTLASVFDLDILLEDVVNALYTGNLHVSRYLGTATDYEKQKTKQDMGSMSVVLRVADQGNWKLRSISGSWRRIIMSIFGNALKYTQSGFIEVSLCKFRKEPEISAPEFAHLSVTDTGCGMSADFLKNKLFSAFTQEDTLSEGVGLGMSIVQQLVGIMKGTIDVKSEPGIGTQVDIFIPITLIPHSPAIPISVASSKTQFCLIGFDGYSDLTEVPTGSLSREGKRRLCIQSFLAHVITLDPNWSVSFAATPSNACGDVVIIEETTLEQMAANESIQSSKVVNSSRLLILRSGPPSSGVIKPANISADVVHTIYPPFCPRKVLEALRRTLEMTSAQTLTKPLNSSTSPIIALDSSGISSTDARKLIPSFGMITPMTERQSFLNVLIVDDNDINLKVLSTFVRKLGHTFETASNGLIALNKYKENSSSFNLVLMDISMPVMDGLVATSQIRIFEKRQSLSPVTVLAVTGVASATMQQQALAAGIDNYLIKPLSLQQLKRAIAKST